jgi:hypothetical protein
MARDDRHLGNTIFGIGPTRAIDCGVEQQVGNRVGRMGAECKRRGVIGQQQHSPRTARIERFDEAREDS